jgi:hypothetical protein
VPTFSWLLRAIPALLAIAAALPATAGAASASATPPGNFERHDGEHWTWYAPPGWVSSEGANDIYVSSPTGTQYLHYGAGGTPCYPPAEFFAGVRSSYQSSHSAFGLYSLPLASARYTKVGPIQEPSPYYYRQSATFQGKRPSGAVVKGEIVLDLFAVDAYGTCGERQQVRSAPSKEIAKSLKLLRVVQSVLFGPR